MKYSVLFGFLILLFSCNASDAGSADNGANLADRKLEAPDIQVQVSGYTTGAGFLVGTYADRQFKLDSARIDANGAFRFKRDEPYTPGLYYILLPDNALLQAIIDQDQTFSLTTSKERLVGDMKVTGSSENELLYQNLTFENEWQARLQELNAKMLGMGENLPETEALKAQQEALARERQEHLETLFRKHPDAFFTAFKQAGQNPEIKEILKPDGTPDTEAQLAQYRADFWENVDFSDPRLLRTPVIINKLRRYIKELTVQHPDSIFQTAKALIDRVEDQPEYFQFFTNWIAIEYEPQKVTMMDREAIFVNMVQNYFTREKAFWADSMQIYALQQRASEMAASLVGKKGPNVSAPDPTGAQRALYDLQKPYLVVFMYNPDCDHCQEETPKLLDLYRQRKNEMDVYAIAINTEDDKWKGFIRDYGISQWTNVHDPTNRSIYATYYVDNTPEIYVLNPERVIIGKNLKPFQVATIIDRDKE